MAIVKESYSEQIEMRGPGNWSAKPLNVGNVSTLRYDDGATLDAPRLTALFNEAAKDFPGLDFSKVTIEKDRIKIADAPQNNAYKNTGAQSIGARG